ncbi:hypothetical protein FB451DRAFT_1166126 [Mycena latifolia]|nr:hypothetical protein FB451DRAFT_1166126 [Mycena latifolia]
MARSAGKKPASEKRVGDRGPLPRTKKRGSTHPFELLLTAALVVAVAALCVTARVLVSVTTLPPAPVDVVTATVSVGLVVTGALIVGGSALVLVSVFEVLGVLLVVVVLLLTESEVVSETGGGATLLPLPGSLVADTVTNAELVPMTEAEDALRPRLP